MTRPDLIKITRILLLAGLLHQNGAYAQSRTELDSIISQVPLLMRQDENKARKLIGQLSSRSVTTNYSRGIIKSIFFRAWLSYRHDSPDITIQKIDSALQHINGIEKDSSIVDFHILKGQCYVKKTQSGPAIEEFQKALKIASGRKDHESETKILISIGWTYMEDDKPRDAIRFFEEVLSRNPSRDYASRPLLLCNIAACYNATEEYEKAETYARQGIEAARTRGNNMDLANGLNILGKSYQSRGKINKAISCLKEAAIVREKVADPSMLISDYLQLSDLYMINKQPAIALQWSKKAEVISEEAGIALKMAAVYQSLANVYEATGDYKRSAEYLKKEINHRDSLERDQYIKALAQMQVQFETQKKTSENLQLKKENLEARLRYSDQQRWMIILGTGMVLLVASAVYWSKLVKSRYKTRLAEEKLKEQKSRTIAVMEAEENERRRIAGDLHDGVGQMIAAASVQLEKARRGQLPLDKVDEMIRNAGIEVRNISHQVTPELLLHHGLVKALEFETDRLNEAQDQVVFSLFVHEETPVNDEMLSLTLYRCFQELSANILKHASANNVEVHLNLYQDEIQLLVEDDGKGFDVGEVKAGLGIRNMKSRIALYDGQLQIDSMEGKGTSFTISIARKES
jgi:signal transduction histidine kinase